MPEHEVTTRPAWVLAASAILLLGALLLAWNGSAAGECTPGDPAAPCEEDGRAASVPPPPTVPVGDGG